MARSNPIINANGDKYWILNGHQYHRADGPDGPVVEYKDGANQWWVDDKRHRLDGPAIEHADGTKEWWVNGKRHREDGPAVKCPDGHKGWYLNGKHLFKKDFKSLDQIIKMQAVELFTPQEIVSMRLDNEE